MTVWHSLHVIGRLRAAMHVRTHFLQTAEKAHVSHSRATQAMFTQAGQLALTVLCSGQSWGLSLWPFFFLGHLNAG